MTIDGIADGERRGAARLAGGPRGAGCAIDCAIDDPTPGGGGRPDGWGRWGATPNPTIHLQSIIKQSLLITNNHQQSSLLNKPTIDKQYPLSTIAPMANSQTTQDERRTARSISLPNSLWADIDAHVAAGNRSAFIAAAMEAALARLKSDEDQFTHG